jgi:hypothetical protein
MHVALCFVNEGAAFQDGCVYTLVFSRLDRHGCAPLPQGGSTTGLSATDALAEPLPVMGGNLAQAP